MGAQGAIFFQDSLYAPCTVQRLSSASWHRSMRRSSEETRRRSALGSYLVGLGASVDVQDTEGNTPLHHTARNNTRLVASMLLWAGGSRILKNRAGETPLHIAARTDAAEVAWLIVQNEDLEEAEETVLGKDLQDARDRTPPEVAQAAGSARVLAVFAGEEPRNSR